MYKKLVVLALVALTVGSIFLFYPKEGCGDCTSDLVERGDAKVEPITKEAELKVTREQDSQVAVTIEGVEDNKNQSFESMNPESSNLNALNSPSGISRDAKYDGDYRNDLLTRFMQDDFEQFMEEKNLQVNNVQCKDAVSDIDFYSTVPLYNNEDLRNDLILDIAIQLQSNGLLSKQNQISNADNNYENIKFSVRMDEEDN